MHAELSVSREDYLKAILEAESEGHTVAPSLLATWLEVSPPAVTKALKRLREDGFVQDRAEGVLTLTDTGREAARRTALRHFLVERMLSEIFGMEWHHIHAEAERLEHVISPEFEAKLLERFGEDGTCPHGNGILPEAPDQLRRRGLIPLSEGEPGARYRVESLYERDGRLLAFLHGLGIGPRVPVRVLEHNYDDTLRLRIGTSTEVTLGRSAADRVFVSSIVKPRR